MLGHLLPFVEGIANLLASPLGDFGPEYGFIRRLVRLIIAPEVSYCHAKGFAPPWSRGKIVYHCPDIAKSLIRIAQGNRHRPLNACVAPPAQRVCRRATARRPYREYSASPHPGERSSPVRAGSDYS